MENYTPIDVAKLPSISNKPIKNYINKFALPFSVVFFSISLFVFLLQNNTVYKSKASSNNPTPIIVTNNNYKNLDEINLIPLKVNNAEINVNKIKSSAKKKYPSLNDKELVKTINTNIFSYLALNEFNRDKKSEVIEDFELIENQILALRKEYEKNLIKLNGFFIKVRFDGIYPENMNKLNKTREEFKILAKTLIDDYINKAENSHNPLEIINLTNLDETRNLLNNNEIDYSFEDYSLYPAIFDDPDFINIITNSPLNEFSPVTILKTQNPNENTLREYAYVSFYISKKTGVNLPINILINEFIEKATIK